MWVKYSHDKAFTSMLILLYLSFAKVFGRGFTPLQASFHLTSSVCWLGSHTQQHFACSWENPTAAEPCHTSAVQSQAPAPARALRGNGGEQQREWAQRAHSAPALTLKALLGLKGGFALWMDSRNEKRSQGKFWTRWGFHKIQVFSPNVFWLPTSKTLTGLSRYS